MSRRGDRGGLRRQRPCPGQPAFVSSGFGFLYFRDEKPGAAVEVLVSLVEAGTGQTFGTISIPFTVR